MSNTIALSTEDIRLLHERLPYKEARAVRLMISAIGEFMAASDKERVALDLAERLAPLRVRGLSAKSLYRKAAAIERHGWRGVIDGRTLRKLERGGIGANREFVDHWHVLVSQNQRKTAPAWRALLSAINRGEHIPGLGTWQQIWQAENPGKTAPSECPYGVIAPNDQIPRNLSYPTLMRIKPSAFGIAASRVGLMRASTDHLPDVIRTRVGLKRCQVIQIDDMWDNTKVMFGTNRYGERVVELSAIDVLTGRIICYLSKPIIRRDDNTRQTLRSEWVRYLLAHIICTVGIPDKCLIMGEHGTATVDKNLREILDDISGSKIVFGAGGLLSEPMAKGLYEGTPAGNPKYKGLMETLQSFKQNELGAIKGQIGSRDSMNNEPENLYGIEKQERALATVVTAMAAKDPNLQGRLAWPWLLWSDYAAIKDALYTNINARTSHQLEGWEDCGFVAAEWRPADGQPWMPISTLDNLGEAGRAMREMLRQQKHLFRIRRMSPDEAWHQRASDVQPLGDWAAPLIMGDKLTRICSVNDKLEMFFKDETTMRNHKIYGIVNGTPLDRHAEYKVWVNPCDPGKAYIADLQGRFIGIAKVAQVARYDDFETIQKALGVRQQALSAEVERLRPVAYKRLRDAAADAQRNVIEIIGKDPYQEMVMIDHLETTTPAADMAEMALAAPAAIQDNDTVPLDDLY